MKRVLCLLLLLAGSLFSPKLGAHASVSVSTEDPVYRQIEKLVAHGLIRSHLLGQRPYTRAEIARLVAEALERYPQFAARYRDAEGLPVRESGRRLRAKVYVDRALRELKSAYRDELVQRGTLPGEVPAVRGRWLDELRFEWLYLRDKPVSFEAQNDFGSLSAGLRPLVENRGGRRYTQGTNFSFETLHWAVLGEHVALQAEPRFQAQVSRPVEEETGLFAQRLNGRFNWGSFDIEIGRDSLHWGPSSRGGLVFSGHARPLDFAKISSVHPFYYPSFFRRLGPQQWSLVFANLGPEQHFRNPWLVALKNSRLLLPELEMGSTSLFEWGGEGRAESGLKKGVNRAFDFEIRGRIPRWRGLELYAELYLEDFHKDLGTLFGDDLSYRTGIYVPRLDYSGIFDLRLEHTRNSPRYARHHAFQEGLSQNGFLLGDPLGPDAWKIEAQLRCDATPQTLFELGFQFSTRHPDRAAKSTGAADERRYRTGLGVRHRWNDMLTTQMGVGFEKIEHFRFDAQSHPWHWMAEAGFRLALKGPR